MKQSYGTKYSRMDQVKFCGREPLKNLAWSILKYFVSNKTEFIP